MVAGTQREASKGNEKEVTVTGFDVHEWMDECGNCGKIYSPDMARRDDGFCSEACAQAPMAQGWTPEMVAAANALHEARKATETPVGAVRVRRGEGEASDLFEIQIYEADLRKGGHRWYPFKWYIKSEAEAFDYTVELSNNAR